MAAVENRQAQPSPKTAKKRTAKPTVAPELNGTLFVSRSDHLKTAKLVRDHFMTADGHPTISRRGGTAWGWNGRHYVLAKDDSIRGDLWLALGRTSIHKPESEGGGTSPYHPNNKSVGNVFNALIPQTPEYELEQAPCWLGDAKGRPPADEIFPAANGLVHVRTGKLYQPTPRFFSPWSSPVMYDPSAACPMWLRFVDTAHEGRQDCMDLHQEIFGYYLISSTFTHQFAIIHGLPGTGKSVALKVLRDIIGNGGFSQMKMSQFGSRDTHAMAQAEHKSVLGVFDARIGPDTNSTEMLATLLYLASGEGVPVRRNLTAGGESHGNCYAKPILATNKYLRLPDPGMAQRLVIMSMNKQFRHTSDEIPNLDKLLKAELPGIINWAIAGVQRLFANGKFTKSPYNDATETLIKERADPFGVFIREYLDIDPEGRVSWADLRNIFVRMYAKSEGLSRTIRPRHVAEQLMEALGSGKVSYIEKTRYVDVNGQPGQGPMFVGVCIKPSVIEAYLEARAGKPAMTETA